MLNRSQYTSIESFAGEMAFDQWFSSGGLWRTVFIFPVLQKG